MSQKTRIITCAEVYERRCHLFARQGSRIARFNTFRLELKRRVILANGRFAAGRVETRYSKREN